MSSVAWYRRLNRTQWLILLVAWLGWVFDIMDTALFNFAKVPMMTEMLGRAQYKLIGPRVEGQIQTFFLIGWAIGGLIFGILADRWGRTRTLIVTILMYCALTGLTAFCRTPEQVMVARFLTALGIGGEWAAGAALVAESFPDDLRSIASSFLQSAAAFGPVFAALKVCHLHAEDSDSSLMPAAAAHVLLKGGRAQAASRAAMKTVFQTEHCRGFV